MLTDGHKDYLQNLLDSEVGEPRTDAEFLAVYLYRELEEAKEIIVGLLDTAIRSTGFDKIENNQMIKDTLDRIRKSQEFLSNNK